MTPDLNVLLAASRADHPQHRPALSWLEQAIVRCETGGSIELLPVVTEGFLRLATNPKLFASPMPIAAAVAFVDSLLVIPGVEMPELGREWPTLRQLSCDLGLAVNAITDAWIAAAVRTIGSHLVTFDKGFRRLLGNAELTVLKPD
jgi:toxin-antitoxin system PIN domain toxin